MCIPLSLTLSAQFFKDPKIASPPLFSCKWKDMEMFIHSCILYINGWPLKFGTEQNKITWILFHMQTGFSCAWHKYIMSQIFKKTLWYNMADDLLQEIQRWFGDTDKQAMISLKIHTMMQKDKIADEHVQDFEKAALEADYKEYPLIVEFKQSLHSVFRKWLSEIWPQHVIIEEWYNEAIMINRQWHITKAEEAFYGRENQSISSWKTPSNQAEMPSVWNDIRPSYNNSYEQGGYSTFCSFTTTCTATNCFKALAHHCTQWSWYLRNLILPMHIPVFSTGMSHQQFQVPK